MGEMIKMMTEADVAEVGKAMDAVRRGVNHYMADDFAAYKTLSPEQRVELSRVLRALRKDIGKFIGK